MKKVMLGFIIGLLVAMPIYSLADTISMIGKKVETELPIKLDGKYLDAKAIAIQGTSYLPVRSLSEAIGYNVQYDGEKREIIVSSPVVNEDPIQPPADVTDPTNPTDPNTEITLPYVLDKIRNLEIEISKLKVQIANDPPEKKTEYEERLKELEQELTRWQTIKEELEKNSNP